MLQIFLTLFGITTVGAETTASKPASTAARAELKMALARFNTLTPNAQKQVEDLHTSLTDEQRLQLQRYERWLDTLSPADRRRLENADSTDSRLAIIRELLSSQAAMLQKSPWKRMGRYASWLWI